MKLTLGEQNHTDYMQKGSGIGRILEALMHGMIAIDVILREMLAHKH